MTAQLRRNASDGTRWEREGRCTTALFIDQRHHFTCAILSLQLSLSHPLHSFQPPKAIKMPESAKSISKDEDPSVTKQWDDSASTEQKFNDAFDITDKLKICMFGSARHGIGPVSRAMAVAKRSGPDFLFLANANSQKFDDLEHNLSLCQIAFHDTQTQNWCCISGEAVKTSNDDKRIKEIYNPSVKAWFGDLGDGTHDGGPEDPRVKLIEVRAKCMLSLPVLLLGTS